MIAYGCVLGLNLLFDKCFLHSQVSCTFTIMRLVAGSTLKLIHDSRSKSFGNAIFEMKLVTCSYF